MVWKSSRITPGSMVILIIIILGIKWETLRQRSAPLIPKLLDIEDTLDERTLFKIEQEKKKFNQIFNEIQQSYTSIKE